jgi:hypothetical protein
MDGDQAGLNLWLMGLFCNATGGQTPGDLLRSLYSRAENYPTQHIRCRLCVHPLLPLRGESHGKPIEEIQNFATFP